MTEQPPSHMGCTGPTRRQAIASFAVLLSPAADAAVWPADLAAAVAGFTRGAPLREGRVTLEIAELVDNGNAVPLSLSVQSPMTPADHVVAVAVFNERNPQREVALFGFGPRSARAQVSTRIRLATSQKLVAVARMNDGSCWSRTVDVIVTIAACIEGES